MQIVKLLMCNKNNKTTESRNGTKKLKHKKMLGNKLKRIFGFAFGRSAPTNSSLWSDGSLDSRVFELRIFWLKSQLCCLTGETLMLRGKIKALTWHESFIRFNHTQKSFVHDSFFFGLIHVKRLGEKEKEESIPKKPFFHFSHRGRNFIQLFFNRWTNLQKNNEKFLRFRVSPLKALYCGKCRNIIK